MDLIVVMYHIHNFKAAMETPFSRAIQRDVDKWGIQVQLEGPKKVIHPSLSAKRPKW